MIDQREKGLLAAGDPQGSFSGDLSEMALPDLVQKLELGKRTGIVRVRAREGREALVWVRDGRIVDCEIGAAKGEAAFYRLLRWAEGEFSVESDPGRTEGRITATNQHLVLEGMRRAGELSRLLRQLPAREDVLQIDYRQLSDRLAEIPDDVNGVLKLVDGRRTVADIVEDAPGDELAAAAILVRLCVEELVRRAVPAAPGGGGAPAPAPATPQPERVTWFTGPADEPRPDAGKPPVQRGDLAPGMTEGPAAQAPRIVRFPPRERDGSPTPTPSEVGFQWDVEAREEPASPARAPGAAQRRPRRAAVGLAVAAGVLVLGVGGAWFARGRSAPLPDDAYRAALLQARRDHQDGRLDAAIEGYRRALAVAETSAARAELGRALRDAGQTSAAVDALRRAVELDARNASAYIAVGEISLRERRLDEARSAFQRYLALEPEGEHAAEARAALAGMR